ncbi:MAG: hypothetical protein ACK55Z_16585, partial [bacterium]
MANKASGQTEHHTVLRRRWHILPTSRVRGQRKPFGVLRAQSRGGAFQDEVTDVAARPRSLKDRTSSFY